MKGVDQDRSPASPAASQPLSVTDGRVGRLQRSRTVIIEHGEPFAAYLSLDRRPDDVAARTEKVAEGLVLDRAEDGRPIGIEITSPRRASLEELNRVLRSVHLEPISPRDLAPLATG